MSEIAKAVAAAVELVQETGGPIALLPNDLGIEDGRYKWTEQELAELVAALGLPADPLIQDPIDLAIELAWKPDVSVYVQNGRNLGKVLCLGKPGLKF